MLLSIAVVLAAIGIALMLFSPAGGRAHFPLGRLPGDFTWRGKNSVVYFPLASSLLISVVLSLIFWLIHRFTR